MSPAPSSFFFVVCVCVVGVCVFPVGSRKCTLHGLRVFPNPLHLHTGHACNGCLLDICLLHLSVRATHYVLIPHCEKNKQTHKKQTKHNQKQTNQPTNKQTTTNQQ